MDRSHFHPVGPLGSVLIGLVLIALHFARVFPGLWAVGMLGFAFAFGGAIMLIARIMSDKKKELPK